MLIVLFLIGLETKVKRFCLKQYKESTMGFLKEYYYLFKEMYIDIVSGCTFCIV